MEAGQRDQRSTSQSSCLERDTHLALLHSVGFAPLLALGSLQRLLHDRAVELHSCGCMETWHVDTKRARADVGATLQGGTAHVVSNAKFAASGDPSLQTCAPKALYKGGGDGDFMEFAMDLAKQYVACLGSALVAVGDALVHMRDVMRVNPRVMLPAALQELVVQVKRAFVLRGRHPWPTQVAPHVAHQCQSWLLGKSTVPHHFPGRRLVRPGQDAIA